MPGNFHSKSFDDATQLKLDIYKAYIETWLPVFIEKGRGGINIFDFFAGPGTDSDGQLGSPLLAIEVCKKFTGHLANHNKSVTLRFNDSAKLKVHRLDQLLSKISVPDQIKTDTSNENFNAAFIHHLKYMSGAANLIFIDQCGIKEVNQNVFSALIGLRQTDFLFFISSSQFNRFKNSPQFKKHLDTSKHINDGTHFSDMHRSIASVYRSMVPLGVEYYLAPFSLKKGSHINGLIFGSGNLLGILKFLKICWQIDPERGEANFDIDQDSLPQTGQSFDLFKENFKSKKVTQFQQTLLELLKAGQFHSDQEVFRHSLENGFLPVLHAKDTVTTAIKDGVITCEGRPRLSEICIKEPRKLTLTQSSV